MIQLELPALYDDYNNLDAYGEPEVYTERLTMYIPDGAVIVIYTTRDLRHTTLKIDDDDAWIIDLLYMELKKIIEEKIMKLPNE